MSDVFLAPDGGHDAAALCTRAAALLNTHITTVTAFADGVHGGWLGECAEGRGWAGLLQAKATGENSLRWLLERHVANLTAIADHFRCTTGAYGDIDSSVIGSQWPTT